jgi:hypothetical protein
MGIGACTSIASVSTEPAAHSKRNAGVGALGFGFGLVLTLLQWRGVHVPEAVFVGGLVMALAICAYGFGAFLLARSPWAIVRKTVWATATSEEPGRTGRQALITLANEVITELETNRYQLEEAKARRWGWTRADMLQAAKFDKWQQSPIAASEVEVMAALRGIYVWMHRLNMEMQAREDSYLETQAGPAIWADGLALDRADREDLDEGLSRIVNAQDHLNAMIARLGKG